MQSTVAANVFRDRRKPDIGLFEMNKAKEVNYKQRTDRST